MRVGAVADLLNSWCTKFTFPKNKTCEPYFWTDRKHSNDHLPPRDSAGAVRNTFFYGVSRKFFFLGFQEHGRQGYLEDFRRTKQLICHGHVDDLRNEKNLIQYVGRETDSLIPKLVDSSRISFKMQLCKTIWVYHVYKCNASTVLWATHGGIFSSLFFIFIT